MIATRCSITTDHELVELVRTGDDSAFEELYRRYHDRIAAYVRRMVRDPARAEDLAQDAFFSALRRMRATDSDIAFKPWIFEIARNATIDHWRRSNRAEEVSVEADELRPSDRGRLVGSAGPDSALVDKERLEHLRGAFDELSDTHTRILVMRELEGLSYREIAEKLDLSRASVESALFRARRRLETEYTDIAEGRRCAAMRTVMARLAEGLRDRRDEARLARHARRCHVCRRRARELGVEPLAPLAGLRRKAAAMLPLPLFARRGGDAAHGGAGSGVSGLAPAASQVGAAIAERAAAIVAAAALAGAGGMALGGSEVVLHDRDAAGPPALVQPAPERTTDVSGAGAAAPGLRGGADTTGSRRAAAPADRAERAEEKPSATLGSEHQPAPGGDEASGALGGGGSGLPLPRIPGFEGGGSGGSSGDGTRLPAAPGLNEVAPPSFEAPQLAPRVEAPQSLPATAPTAPALPALENGIALDAVTDTAAG